jgi:hypothetical protein
LDAISYTTRRRLKTDAAGPLPTSIAPDHAGGRNLIGPIIIDFSRSRSGNFAGSFANIVAPVGRRE